MVNKIAVIDFDSVAFSIFNGNKVLDSDGKPVKVLSQSGNMVFQYIEKTEQELEESADNIIKDIMRRGEFTHYIGFVKGTTAALKANTKIPKDKKEVLEGVLGVTGMVIIGKLT